MSLKTDADIDMVSVVITVIVAAVTLMVGFMVMNAMIVSIANLTVSNPPPLPTPAPTASPTDPISFIFSAFPFTALASVTIVIILTIRWIVLGPVHQSNPAPVGPEPSQASDPSNDGLQPIHPPSSHSEAWSGAVWHPDIYPDHELSAYNGLSEPPGYIPTHHTYTPAPEPEPAAEVDTSHKVRKYELK